MKLSQVPLFVLIPFLLVACTSTATVPAEPTVTQALLLTEPPATTAPLPTFTEALPLTVTTVPPTPTLPVSTPIKEVQKQFEGLYFTDGPALYWLQPGKKSPQLLASNLAEDSEYLNVDPAAQIVYVSHWARVSQVLKFGPLAPQSIETIDGPSDGGGQGIAIDPQAGMMFLGVYYDGIYARDLQGNGEWNQIVSQMDLLPLLGQRGQLQLDPANRQIYFRSAFNGECGECRYIYRVDYDGKNLTRVIRANGGDALALDLSAGKLYFSDLPGHATIKRSNLDGTGVETLLTNSSGYQNCHSLEVDPVEAKLYLYLYEDDINTGKKAVARAGLDGSAFEILFTMPANPSYQGSLALAPGAAVIVPDAACGAGWTRLEIGPYASVTSDNALANRAREAPSLAAKVIGGLPPGTKVKVLEGPVCADGYVFWKVESPLIAGGIGWTAEGDGNEYYLTTNHLLLTTPTEITSQVKLEGDRFVFQIYADRVLPEPRQLRGGGRIDFIWYVDADRNRSTGQTDRGNDYNLHLAVDQTGWSAQIHPVSNIALENVVQSQYAEIRYRMDGQYAELSFPKSMFPSETFRWWLEVTSTNSTESWRSVLQFTASLPERNFPR